MGWVITGGTTTTIVEIITNFTVNSFITTVPATSIKVTSSVNNSSASIIIITATDIIASIEAFVNAVATSRIITGITYKITTFEVVVD